ncbi:MAG TPA: cytochrome o ubiquinol oxidase subunit I, partial [Rhabdochlamydiaceae bacterium]|nr:cytochrome o ubiquinol oxidase subunit I [Rhabdochlamydiaceae bacterium]
LGVAFQFLQFYVSVRDRNKNRDTTGDPWNGRTLEWSTKSPPPFYNFAITPEVHERDAFWATKRSKTSSAPQHYHNLHMPKNTSLGFYIGVWSFLFAFGLIWYMFWLAGVSVVAIVICVIKHLCQKEPDYFISAQEVENMEKA